MKTDDNKQGNLIAEEGSERKPATPKRKSAMEKVQERARQAEEKSQLQLKIWADEIREAPNEALRSALFNARNRNQVRRQIRNEEVASYGTSKVIYSGEELRQDDLDVWLQVLHLGRLQPLGETIYFNPTEMKKALDWGYGKDKTERLKTILTRLKATAVNFHSGRLGKGVVLSIIRKFEYADDEDDTRGGGTWSIELDPEVALLFGGGVYSTRIEWEQRLSLDGNLSKWLHGFYSTHAKPLPLLIDTLLKPTGTKVASKYKAKALVTEAHNELVRVGFLKEFSISKDGLVTVERAPLKKVLTSE